MALSSAKHERIHNKTGSDLATIKANFDNGRHLDAIDFPVESAIMYQIQKMQEELDYLRTEISDNKDNRINLGSNTTISFGDMISTTKKGVTTYTIVMTVTNGGVSKTITHTLA
jgi:hypothetical protein